MSRWYRAYEGTVTDAKLAEVALCADVSRSVAIACWHAILENAATVNDGGRIDIPPRRAAAILCEAPNLIEKVFAEFRAIGLLDDTGVVSWKRRQFESDTSTERSRKHREAKRNADATLQNGDASPPETETETETETEKKEEHPSPPSVVRPPQKTRGEFLPKDWKPNAEGQRMAIAAMGGRDAAWGQLERFRDHWLAKSGADGRKRDWDAAWRNWIRNAVEYEKRNGNYQRQHRPASGSDNAIAALDQLLGGGSRGGGGAPVAPGYDDAERDAAGVYRIPH